MGNFVVAKKLVRIKEIIELWEIELQRINCKLEFLSARFLHPGSLPPFYIFLTRVRT